MNPICGVYAIVNLTDGRWYIGSSVNTQHRFTQHRRDLHTGKHLNRHLQRAWNKDGAEAFDFRIVEVVDPAVRLVREQVLIDATVSRYNMAERAACPPSRRGAVVPEELQARISAANKGRRHSEETKTLQRRVQQARHAVGWKRAPEVVEAWRAKMRGRKLTPEHRAKVSKALRGRKRSAAERQTCREAALTRSNASYLGHIVSLETRAKVSAALMGHPVSEEVRGKMRGRRSAFTPEHCAKISQALRGRTLSTEHKEALSRSARTRTRFMERGSA